MTWLAAHGSTAPLIGSTAAMPLEVTPLMLRNEPPMMTLDLSGAITMERTSEVDALGAQAPERPPLTAAKAASRLR